MLAATWAAYYEMLQSSAREKHGFDALYRPAGSYLETLQRLKPILRIPFTELSGEDMQKMIGYEVGGYDYGWFGSIRSNGQGWHELLHNDDLRDFLQEALAQIGRGTTEAAALRVAQEVFERCVSIPRVGPATPTRLLAIYRPDFFFSVNRNSMGGIYLRADDAHGANPLKLLELVARKWPDYFAPWLPSLGNVTEEALCDTVDRVPAETMDPPQRDFAKALLRVTYRRVKDILS